MFHQSTENFIIGRFIEQTITKIDVIFSLTSGFENDFFKKIIIKYINNKTATDVNLASQTHQVPHIGLPHKDPVIKHISVNVAPIGAGFTFLALATGSLWGKPMWGTWWVWDARLTSVLILFFLYLGFIVLHNAFDDASRGARAAAILAVVGGVNVPIIKFSVDWWNTLHQPASVVKLDGPAIHSSMLTPLLLMASAYTAFYIWMLAVRVRAEINSNKIRAIRIRQTAI